MGTHHEMDQTEQALHAAFQNPFPIPDDLLPTLLSFQDQILPLKQEKKWGLLAFLGGVAGVLVAVFAIALHPPVSGATFNLVSIGNLSPSTAALHIGWWLLLACMWTAVGFSFTFAAPLFHIEN